MLSAPPATANSASPRQSACAAETTACAPDPHSRLTFIAGTVSGMPASIAATRARYMSRGSVLITCPKTTCPTCSGASTPARSSAALVTCVASAVGGRPARLPPNVPIAVRAPPRMTMSVSMAIFSPLALRPSLRRTPAGMQPRGPPPPAAAALGFFDAFAQMPRRCRFSNRGDHVECRRGAHRRHRVGHRGRADPDRRTQPGSRRASGRVS